jgi:hypothetical protein
MNNQISFQSVYQTITERGEFPVGQRASTPDGREWVFVNAAGIIGKNLMAIPNTVTTLTTLSSSTDNQGRIVYLTDTDASLTTGAFQDGIGLVNTGTGSGQGFKIKTNTATVITLYPENALTTALSVVDSGVALKTMSRVLVSAITSKLQQAVGATQVAFASGDYGWLLTEGDGTVVAGEVLVIGSNFVTGATTAGEVLKGTTAKGPFDEQNLGMALVANSGADLGALVRFEVRG